MVSTSFCLYVLKNQKQNIFPDSVNKLKLLLTRGLLGSYTAVAYFIGLKYIPMSVASVLFASKGVFILFYGILLGTENLTIQAVLSVLLCALGTILLIQPSLILSGTISTLEQSENFLRGCFFVFAALNGKALVNIFIKKYGISN